MSDTVEKALRLAKSINAEGKSSGGGAWTRKEGKNPEGGLNEKGRASLRAQGHDIKRPQPEGGSRRDSFCARMKGMKAKLTSKETANDPDSRINKSLRKWNCADGGKVWDKPRPDDLGKPKHLSSAKKAKAKAMAKAAGRPYPNLVDNMRAAKADGGQVGKAMRMIGRIGKDDGGKASKFVQEQLSTGEPQLPQMDREAYNRMKYGARDALHGLSYFTPAAPIVAASDFAHGVYKGNPTEMAGALFAAPNRLAKTIGATTLAQSPEGEGASPIAKFVRSAYGSYDKGGKIDAALRLSDQRIASASGGKSPPQKVPNLYENLDKFYKEETGQIQPKHLERDWRYNILPEEYKRGNLGSGQYALANGGKVKRHGYADGGQPGQAQGQFNPGSYISNVYNQFANRAPNQSETNFWQGQMNQGSTPQQVYQGIANDAGTQAGYYGQYNAADPNSFNTMLNSTYQSYLGRAPNASDTAFWQGQLAQGSTPQQIVQGIANDQAARNYAAQQMAAWGASGNVAPQAAAPAQQAAPQSVSNTGVIGAAYNQYLGRAPTQDEVNFWQGELNKGVSPQQIMQGISSDAGVRQSYANQYNPANQSTFNNLLNSTYQAYLGRAPNESDIAFWQGELNKGVSPQQIVSGIANDQASKNFLASQASQFGPVSAPSAAPSSAPSSQPSSGQADPETSDAISAIYNQYMGRSPTSDEVNYWSNELAKGKSFADFSNVVSNDLSSKNYANNQFIIDEYQGLLGRDPNSDELNYWQGQLNKGSSRAQIDAAISSDPGSQAYQASNFAPYQVASSSGNSGISSGPRTAEQANASVPRSSQELQNHFGPLEQAYGLPTGSLMAMSKIESEYGTNQHRAGSQYKGMMQLGNDIVKKYNVKNVYDWRQNSDAAAQYMRDNAKEFVDKTGTQPQIGDFYGMHQQGATGWSNMVSKPNDLAYKTVGLQKVLQNVPAELASKAKSLTNAQFREFFNGKIEQGLSGPDGKGRDVLFGGASSAPPAPPPMIPTGVGESGTGGIFPSGGIAGLDSSLSGFTPISGSGGVDYTAPATPMASYTPPAAPVAPSISHTPSVSHTGGGGSHTVSHGSGSVSFAPPASSGGGSGTIDPYFGHAGSTHYDPRYGNGVGGGADWEWDYAKKRGGKISDKKDMKVYSRPAGGSHNRGAKAVKDALRLARK